TAQSVSTRKAEMSTGDFHVRNSPIYDDIGDTVTGSGGNVRITAGSLNLTLASISTTAFNGTGGAVNLDVANIQLKQGSFVETTGWDGKGSMKINTNKRLRDGSSFLEGKPAFAQERDITITANAVELTNGSAVRTETEGNAPSGNIIVTATDHITLKDGPVTARPSGFYSNSLGFDGVPLDTLGGRAGNIMITTPKLDMSGGARINSGTETSGRGGDVTIHADSISIAGERTLEIIEDFFNVGAGGTTSAGGIFTGTVGKQFCSGSCGDAGHISINTGSLTLGSGATINSTTSSTGRGGDITINAANTTSLSGTLQDGTPDGIFSQSIGTAPGSGEGGDITLTAGQSLTISNGASVSASTMGPGDAGIILVKADSITMNGGATISASSTGAGNAGTVTIEGTASPAQSVLIDGAHTRIFTTTSSTGTGGDISIDANAVTLQNGAHVSSSSTGLGTTRNITITPAHSFTAK